MRRLAPAAFLLLWSAGFSFVALGLPDSEPFTFLALRYAIVVALLALAIPVVRPPLPGSGRDWIDLAISLGYLVLANSLVSITLLLMMMRRGEASRVSALFFLVPPLAGAIAWAVLGESLPAPAWAGMVLAAIGVGIATAEPELSRSGRGSS
jgi:drug/metabolite transporter (DMT)-like permease